LTATELRECLAVLHWSQRGLAVILDCDEGLVRRWARGAAAIPQDLGEWLCELARFHQTHPAPTWKRRAA